jgi:hypothetical protein
MQPFNQMIADTQRIGNDGQSRTNASVGWEKTAIDDIEIIDIMGATIQI